MHTASGRKPTPLLNKPMRAPLISVIVMTYENIDNVYRTLDSVLMQDYPNLELIVSDDGSKSFSNAEIETYLSGKALSYRVRQNTKNLGTVAHCNTAVAETSGEYIKFLASGDGFCKENSLRKLVEFAQGHPETPAVTSVSHVCNEDFTTVYYNFPSQRRVEILNNRPPEKLYNTLVFSNIVSAVGTLFRREFFTRYQGFNTDYKLLEDLPTWLYLTRNGTSIPCSPVATVYYALGGVSSQKGTAFESKALRDDMILCYEQEILPHLDKIPFIIKRFALYQYEKLKKYDNRITFGKVRFFLKYAPFEAYRSVKYWMKRLLTAIKGGWE